MDTDIALLILRIVFGVSLAAHGAQKLFGWWDGPGLAGFAGWLESMGVRGAKVAALIAGLVEFVGGIAFAAGLLTPLVALGIVVVMTTAVLNVHLKAGFFNGSGGWEYNLAIATVAVAVAITGAGEYSVDDALGLMGGFTGWEWGLGIAVVGVLVGVVNNAMRTPPPAAPLGE
ncbi:MAG: DoxX [Thermoleophilia bacterium]|nr:DoxX [Thermoleophilia bacterium]